MSAKVWTAVAAVLVAVLGWSAAASAIWCAGTDVCPVGEWPLLQWWFVVPYWRENWFVALWIGFGAFFPSVVVLLMIWAAWTLSRRKTNVPLHGDTGWDKEERQKGAMSTNRSPF